MKASVVMTGIAAVICATVGYYYGGWELGGSVALVGGIITASVHCRALSSDTSDSTG